MTDQEIIDLMPSGVGLVVSIIWFVRFLICEGMFFKNKARLSFNE